ncbi:MAG: enoyl-CoA hydratase/isomerase family protein [Flavobacteriales bacterium]|nr:enoyl-CoA hydratase/isomerase family protein [Flavobacteriales bacterium]
MLYTAAALQKWDKQVFAHLIVNVEDHLLTITLNRPEKKNAMTPVMITEIAYALAYAHQTPDIRAVVIQANGDTFCAGADLKAFMGEVESTDSTIPNPEEEILIGELFIGLHKPCITKVEGPVYAGGFLLICGCTHVVAADSATFSLPEVKRGIWPMQVMESLLQILPARKVLDLCMRANVLSGADAKELGLVTHSVPQSELDSVVQDLLNDIMQNSPNAIHQGLKAYDELRRIDKGEKHAYLKKKLGELFKSEDAAEGLKAFKEKRAPNWTGK